jgi:hypothetical protein
MNYNIENNLSTNIDLTGLGDDGNTIRRLNLESVKAIIETDDAYREIKVQPETFKVGDLISFHGCICKVEKIKVTNRKGVGDIYTMSSSYVTGRLDMFKWFLGYVCNGCFRGNLALTTGNNKRPWFKAEAIV